MYLFQAFPVTCRFFVPFRRCLQAIGRFRFSLAATAAAAIAVPVFVFAATADMARADGHGSDSVVARVDDIAITESHLKALENFFENNQDLPEIERRGQILDLWIALILFSEDARRKNLDKGAEFQALYDFVQRQALREQYFIKEIEARIAPDAARKFYDEQVQGFQPETEVRARHILVKTEEEAKTVIAELDSGKDFAEVAKEKSTGPSGASGGDLGYFTRERMVKPFADAAFALETGAISQPVETQFGWHVIKLEDKRETAPPPFEQVEEQISKTLCSQAADKALKSLRSAAKIEILDKELKEKLSSSDNQ